MKVTEVLVLAGAGTLGGIFSTVVAIASLVTYPVLLALGVPPLSANMTNTVSLVLTGAGSVAGSRPELAGQRDRVLRLAAVTAAGGLAGAANPLNVPLSGLPANIVTRVYHLGVMQGNRSRVLTDWTLNATTPQEMTSLDVISAASVPLDPNTPREPRG